MDQHPVTVAEYPDADPALLVPGSLVFHMTNGPVNLDDYRNWWHWGPGACRRHPRSAGSIVCARNYRLRYRPAACQGQTIETSTGHIGFRCIVRAAARTPA
jgi:hypothetical protein